MSEEPLYGGIAKGGRADAPPGARLQSKVCPEPSSTLEGGSARVDGTDGAPDPRATLPSAYERDSLSLVYPVCSS